jgi:hypothetical protein
LFSGLVVGGGGGRLAFYSQLAARGIGGVVIVIAKITVRLGPNRPAFSEHHQQKFTMETMVTAHAYILSCIGMTSLHFDVMSFTFAFRSE